MPNAYEFYYKLSADPFRINPDHNFSCGHRSYARAKAYLTYALQQGEGFVIITGGAGTGKTTLINEILAELDKKRVRVASLTTARLVSLDLLHMVAVSFGLHPEKMDKVTLLTELEQFLIEENRKGWRTILIVDEAQGLSHSGVEELRLLANLQFNNQLLLQIFLVGQERLADLLRGSGMEQLRQRVIAASHLEPLDLGETVTYVEQRLFRAGWRGDPKISEAALRLVHAFSGGVPRRINLVCSRLLLYGSMEGTHDLTGQDARNVLEDLRQELLITAEPFDETERFGQIKMPNRGGQAPARDLPRKESFELFRQSSQPSGRQDSGRSPMDPVRAGGEGATVPPVLGRDPRDRGTESADTLVWQWDESEQGRAPPGTYIEQSAGRWTGKTLGITTVLLIAGVLLMAVIRPEIRDSLFATYEDQDSVRPSQTESSGTDEHRFTTGVEDTRISRRDSMPAREQDDSATPHQLMQEEHGVASTRTLQTAPPAEMETAAEAQPPVTLALRSSRIGAESESRISLTIAPEPEEQGDPGATHSVAEEGLQEGRASQRKEAEQLWNRQLTQRENRIGWSDSPEGVSSDAHSGVAAEPKTETAARTETKATETKPVSENVTTARTGSPAPRLPTENEVTPAISAEMSGRLPVSTGTSLTAALGPEAAENTKKAPPVVSPLPAVTKLAVVATLEPVNAPGADKLSVPAGRDVPVLIAKATPPLEGKTLFKDTDQFKLALLEGKWKSRGKPAVLLPSDITFCKSGQDRINCWSIPQNINTKYGKALYKVEGTLQDFSSQGDFGLSYRTLVRLVRNNDANRSDAGPTSGDGGWQVTEHTMSCSLTQPNNVRCRDEKGVTRDYRRLGPVGRL